MWSPLWQPTVLWPCACPWLEMWPWSVMGMCCSVCSSSEAPHGCPSCLPHKDRAPHPQWGLTGGQAPLGAAQEPPLASREMPQGRTKTPPLLPFISHPSLFVPLCFNFFNCWTYCWTPGNHNSVFFKCKSSQCCLFGDSVFNSAIFIHKSAFPQIMNFTCVSPEAIANPVWGYTFSYDQSFKKNTIFFLIFLFLHFASFGFCAHICLHSGGFGDPDAFSRVGLLLPTPFYCCSAPWKQLWSWVIGSGCVLSGNCCISHA